MPNQKLRAILCCLTLALLLQAVPRTVGAQTDSLKTIEGTIVKTDANNLIVHTDKGDVIVSLGEKTQITVSEQIATIADLKEGQQVSIVIDGTQVISVEVALQTARMVQHKTLVIWGET
jgi:hypothetical protein